MKQKQFGEILLSSYVLVYRLLLLGPINQDDDQEPSNCCIGRRSPLLIRQLISKTPYWHSFTTTIAKFNLMLCGLKNGLSLVQIQNWCGEMLEIIHYCIHMRCHMMEDLWKRRWSVKDEWFTTISNWKYARLLAKCLVQFCIRKAIIEYLNLLLPTGNRFITLSANFLIEWLPPPRFMCISIMWESKQTSLQTATFSANNTSG